MALILLLAGVLLLCVLAGGQAGNLLKHAGKMVNIVIANVKGHLGDRQVLLPQQPLGLLNPGALGLD